MARNLASAGKRVGGALIDIVIVTILFVVYGSVFGQSQGGLISVTGLPAFGFFILTMAYYIVMEGATGKTVGKFATRMTVKDENGNRLSWGQSVARNLLRIVDGLFMYLVGFIAVVASKDNQRVGDMASKTYVENDQ